MAQSVTTITGLAEMHAAMQDLTAKVEGSVMRGALRAGQKVFQQAAVSTLEAAGAVDSGALRDSIKIRFKPKSQKHGWVRLHLQAGNKKAWYSHLIEYGTASYYTGKGKTVGKPYEIKPKTAKGLLFGGKVHAGATHPGVKPRPFMRPALDGHQQQALQATVDYIRTRLPKELKKAGK